MKEIEHKINKLMSETKLKLTNNSQELSVILIDFANEYNKIWRELEK